MAQGGGSDASSADEFPVLVVDAVHEVAVGASGAAEDPALAAPRQEGADDIDGATQKPCLITSQC